MLLLLPLPTLDVPHDRCLSFDGIVDARATTSRHTKRGGLASGSDESFEEPLNENIGRVLSFEARFRWISTLWRRINRHRSCRVLLTRRASSRLRRFFSVGGCHRLDRSISLYGLVRKRPNIAQGSERVAGCSHVANRGGSGNVRIPVAPSGLVSCMCWIERTSILLDVDVGGNERQRV